MLRVKAGADIECIHPLHTVCKILAILPPVKLCDVEVYKCKYLHGILAIGSLLAAYILTSYGKVVSIWPRMPPTAFVLDMASDLCLIMANVAAIACVNLKNGLKVCDFLAGIKRIDHEFRHVTSFGRYPNARFVVEMILVHVYLAIMIGFNVFTWAGTVGLDVYRFYILKDVQNYFIVMLATLLRNYAYAINYRFQVMNRLLSEMFVADPEDEWTLRKIIKLYSRLANMVDQYNDIFGWQFVTLYINIVINLLQPMNVALVYGDGKQDFNGVTFGWELIVLCILWGSLPVIIGSSIYSACNRAAGEIKRTAVISYNLSQELSADTEDRICKRELLELARLSSSRCPDFTAAGFYTVNYSVLFGLVGSITSYLIVLIQFN